MVKLNILLSVILCFLSFNSFADEAALYRKYVKMCQDMRSMCEPYAHNELDNKFKELDKNKDGLLNNEEIKREAFFYYCYKKYIGINKRLVSRADCRRFIQLILNDKELKFFSEKRGVAWKKTLII